MTLEQIKIKIGERVDDPDGTAYAERYEGIFITAMIDVIKAVDKNGNALFSPSEYPELVAPKVVETTFNDGFTKIAYSELNAIFVRGVYTNPMAVNIDNRIIFLNRTLEELEFIRSNKYFEPDTGEGYWAEKSDSLFILISITRTRVPAISIDIIKNPSTDTWGTDDLETVYFYGRDFIEAAIKRAAEILRGEIGLE